VVVYSDEKTDMLKGDVSRIGNRKAFFKQLSYVWRECERTLIPGGYLVVNFQDTIVGSKEYGYPREICIAGDMVNSVESSMLYLIARWIWKKHESGLAISKAMYSLYDHITTADPRPVGNWEYVFAFRKRGTAKPRTLDFTRDQWKQYSDGVWHITTEPYDEKIGGAAYPVELPKRIIRIYTKPGDIVLDPFLGTGTTMQAAFQMRRSCIGYEIRPEMEPVIKSKVGWGATTLTGETIEWKVTRK
jgi:site-specific DNA-methyltransferase (adenine-specific)